MIQFNKIALHNFGCYVDAELNLTNRGFCLVSGQNNYLPDNALSNGVGKSILLSSICWTLCGETVSGLKSGLRNVATTEDLSYASVEFKYNSDEYIITRMLAPRSELKIIKNGIDVSGKGIRESEKKLNELLPELTRDLITSSIILGQGMPNKFSSFSPSGRKDLIERLTKSDFMIEDLRTRIENRQLELQKQIRELDDAILVSKTQLTIETGVLKTLEAELADLATPDTNIDLRIAHAEVEIEKLTAAIALLPNLETANNLQAYEKALADIQNAKLAVSQEELSAYNEATAAITTRRAELTGSVNYLQQELTRQQSITDTCPTCGQKIAGVHKPDTTKLEAELAQKTTEIDALDTDLQTKEKKHLAYKAEIEAHFEAQIKAARDRIEAEKLLIRKNTQERSGLNAQLATAKEILTKLTYDKKHAATLKASTEAKLAEKIIQVDNLTAQMRTAESTREGLIEHQNIVKKMSNIVKRDFRGQLLSNIVIYLDSKAKDFCEIVFGTRELTIELSGNNLDITYLGKAFDGLSGGEKQRVDLILQLAIRDLLIKHLGLEANILVLDEVTDFLDKKSCAAIVRLLESELNTVESVFIISHMADSLELPVDSTITIVKSAEGISEVVE